MKLIYLVFVFLLVCSVRSARILGVFPLAGRSHYILGMTLMRSLAEKGHDVTMISPFSENTLPKNGKYRNIILKGALEEMEDKTKNEINMFEMDKFSPFASIFFMGGMMADIIEKTFKDENVQKLISSNEKFDVVIVEHFFNDAHKALATHFGAPLILFSPLGANIFINSLVRNPSPSSYIPDINLQYSIQMTPLERLNNWFFKTFTEVIQNLYLYPQQNKIVKKYLPNGPDLYEVLYNSSIVLMNSHPSINQAVPHLPNMIEIGGFHVKPPKKLPQDLQEFLDGAEDGVIYFSLGSNLKSSQLPLEKREAFLKTFAKLKLKVLWKWEEDSLPGQPPNVKLGKWLPQQDILAHPNVKLFITHGGLLSTTETVYHGVPILVIPVFGDQKMNARAAVNNGFGLSLPYSEISGEKLTELINEILSNSKYKDNAKMRSEVFHDRPLSPMDTAIYWVEYVIRHKGAPHLRIAALDLPWHVYESIDVISIIALLFLLLLIIIYIIIKVIWKRRIVKKSSKKVKRQ